MDSYIFRSRDSSSYNVVLGDTFIKKTSDGQVIADVEEIFTVSDLLYKPLNVHLGDVQCRGSIMSGLVR